MADLLLKPSDSSRYSMRVIVILICSEGLSRIMGFEPNVTQLPRQTIVTPP